MDFRVNLGKLLKMVEEGRKEGRKPIVAFSILFIIWLLPQIRTKLRADASPLEDL